MRTLGIKSACVVLIVGAAVAWWTFVYPVRYPTYSYRYRMTVEVMVDGALHSGSSVIEIELKTQPKVGDSSSVLQQVHGDAVFVDLGGGRNVVALLTGGAEGEQMDQPVRFVPLLFPPIYTDRDQLPKLASLRGHGDVPEGELPTLASFDLNDPSNARVVRPDEFEAVFGPGVRFKRVWIDMTDEPVTRGIEKKFPWWNAGPFLWERRVREGIYVDMRPPGFRWNKNMLKRDM